MMELEEPFQVAATAAGLAECKSLPSGERLGIYIVGLYDGPCFHFSII